MAAPVKCLAQSNKSRTGDVATNKRRCARPLSGLRHAAIDIDKTFAHRQIGMRTPGRSRRFSRPHCPRCKLRLSKRSPVVCPKDAEINCICCDHCRRECALDAQGIAIEAFMIALAADAPPAIV